MENNPLLRTMDNIVIGLKQCLTHVHVSRALLLAHASLKGVVLLVRIICALQ